MLIMCSIHLRYIIAWYAHLSFSMKKANMMLKQIGEVNEIHLSNNKYTQKNTLCTNKIYFCPICVNCLPKNVHFFFFFFLEGGHCPLSLPQLVRLCARPCSKGNFRQVLYKRFIVETVIPQLNMLNSPFANSVKILKSRFSYSNLVFQRFEQQSSNLWRLYRNVHLCSSSRQQVFCKRGVLKNFVKFKGKDLCEGLFFNKVAGFRPETET